MFDFSDGQLLKLEKPLSVLDDSGDYCAETFSPHVTGNGEDDVNMEPTAGYLSLYFKLNDTENIKGMVGLYVDDSIVTGNNEFEQFTKRTKRK